MRVFFAVLAAFVLSVLPSCASSSTSPDTPASDSEAGAAATAAVDSELYISDEGAGCAVYVSVSESSAADSEDQKALIWQGLIHNGFDGCDFSDVEEVGLITVSGLDEYDQPDWSTVVEHSYYSVQGWPALMESCLGTELSPTCDDLVDSSFVDR